MEKTRELFKKTGDIKGMIHARISTVKDRNTKNIKQKRLRSGKNMQNCIKKVLMTQITMMMWPLT